MILTHIIGSECTLQFLGQHQLQNFILRKHNDLSQKSHKITSCKSPFNYIHGL